MIEFDDGGVIAFEVNANERVTGGDFKGLRKLREVLGSRFIAGVAFSTGARSYTYQDRLECCPWTGCGPGQVGIRRTRLRLAAQGAPGGGTVPSIRRGRELVVLKLLGKGCTAQAIAHRLGVSPTPCTPTLATSTASSTSATGCRPSSSPATSASSPPLP